MEMKSALKVFGTLLILLAVFGFLFPNWGHTVFTNNENLFHLLVGLAAILLAEFSSPVRQGSLLILALAFLALGVYGFVLKHPADFHIKHVTAQLDLVDNILHLLFGLGFAWGWFNRLKTF